MPRNGPVSLHVASHWESWFDPERRWAGPWLCCFLYSYPQCTASFRFLLHCQGVRAGFQRGFILVILLSPASGSSSDCAPRVLPACVPLTLWLWTAVTAHSVFALLGVRSEGQGARIPASCFSLGSDAEGGLGGGLLSESALLAVVGDLQWFI